MLNKPDQESEMDVSTKVGIVSHKNPNVTNKNQLLWRVSVAVKWCRNRGLATKNGITFVYVRPTKHGVHTTSYNHHHDLVGGAISILKNMSSSVWEGLSYI